MDAEILRLRCLVALGGFAQDDDQATPARTPTVRTRKAMLMLHFALALLQNPAPTVLVGNDPVAITSFQFSDIMAESPGALGLDHFLKLDNHVSSLRAEDLWTNLIRSSVASLKQISTPNIRARIVLANGKQLVFDQDGRFIETDSSLQVLFVWKGPVRELRSSQFRRFLEITQWISLHR